MNNILVKILGVIRFFFFRVVNGKKFQPNGLYVFEEGVRIKITKKALIKIGKKAHLFRCSELQSKDKLIIGKRFNLNSYSRIISHDKIEIGDNVTIAQFVSILDHDHRYEFINGKMVLDGYNTAPIHIGSDVWIGDKVTILKGVKIGNNVIVGANTLVNKDIPSNSLVAGNPGKVLKQLYHE